LLPPLPSAIVPLQTQLRAFVEMAGASCTACGSGLIIVRSRRDAAAGDSTAVVRCSLYLARAADGQRVCRQRVDTNTVFAWYDASVSARRLPQPAQHAAAL
jgi:hypothetical protein